MKSRRPALAVSLFVSLQIVLLTVPVRSGATITHELRAQFVDVSGVQTAVDDASTTFRPPLETPPEIDIRVGDPRGQLQASIGRFGNYGIAGSQGGAGGLGALVRIDNRRIENLSGTALAATANFIIDGGQLILDFAPGASIMLELELSSDLVGDALCPDEVCFSSTIELMDDGTGTRASASFSGEDIGASFDGRSVVDIPISFQSVDLGVIPAGGFIDLEYTLAVTTLVPEFAEVLRFRFQDPLSVDGIGQRFEIALSAVPEPTIGVAPLLGLLFSRARRHPRFRGCR
ncbi:MAG: hypothetical protein QNK05_15570 [Myxococcota bacterium]|nr:hypothetical protein [Myxococcota bacterium]